jgi:hypothetical protein
MFLRNTLFPTKLSLKERVFDAGSSRREVTYFTNLCTLCAMLLSLGLSGDLIGATVFAVNNTSAALHMVSAFVLDNVR